MKQNTRITLACLLTATGAALHALAEEISSATPTDKPEAAPEPVEAPKPKRAPKAEKAAPAPAPTPEPEAPAPTEEKPADPAPAADEETQEAKDARYQANRAMIQPFVQNPNWTADKRAALKGILAKLSPATGGLVDLPLANQEAFERDFEALTL